MYRAYNRGASFIRRHIGLNKNNVTAFIMFSLLYKFVHIVT